MIDNPTIMGISHLCCWNPGVALIKDNKLIFFAEEERYNRIKGSPSRFPVKAIEACLDFARIDYSDIDYIATGMLKGTQIVSDSQIMDAVTRLFPNNKDFKWFSHHLSHAASSIIPSGFKETNFITSDGQGDWDSGIYGYFDGEINILGRIPPRNSLGNFYSWSTSKCNFKIHEQEGKLMGLASYGKPDESLDAFTYTSSRDNIIRVNAFEYQESLQIPQNPIVFNRTEDASKKEEYINLAATTQKIFEKSILSILNFLNKKHYSESLCVAGGSFLNCTANGKIAKKVKNMFIQPASTDSGTALGAAILAYKELTNIWPDINFESAYWGSGPGDIEKTLENNSDKITFKKQENISKTIAILVHNNNVIGYVNGRAEVGPRALCHRSIIANPTIKDNLRRVNNIKNREQWRPLAPVIKEESFFEIVDSPCLSPFMLMACEVKDAWRSKIPAVTHVDNSCRPQTIALKSNPEIHEALTYFETMSGVPVFMNTSFNLNGEPLVQTTQDAINTFLNSELDYLIVQDYLISRI